MYWFVTAVEVAKGRAAAISKVALYNGHSNRPSAHEIITPKRLYGF